MIALSPVSGYTQNPGLSIGPRSRAFSIIHSYHPQSSTFFDAIATNGTVPSVDKLIAHDLYIRRITNALPPIGWQYVFTTNSAAGCMWNAGTAGPSDGKGTSNGTVSYNGGAQSDGTTGYINTNKTPAQVFNLTDGVMGVYKRTAEASGDRCHIGAFSGSRSTIRDYLISPVSIQGSIGAVSAAELGVTTTPFSGLHLVSVRGNRINHQYRGATEISSSTETGSLVAIPLYILAANSSGSPTFYSSVRLGLAFFGSTGFSAAQVSLLNTYVAEYMAALGRTAT